MYLNTIMRTAYNAKEREALNEEYTRVYSEYQAMRDEAFAIEDDDEYDAALDEADKYYAEIVHPAYLRCFAAQFHKCKNAWFESVINGFEADGQVHNITPKQYDCFLRYACDTDSNSWKDGTSYCRVGNKLVTLYRHNSLIGIKITLL